MPRDPENVTRYTEIDHHEDYREAIEWFKSNGFNINNSRYMSIMRQIGEFGEGQYSADLIWGMSEVNVLYLVYRDLLRHMDLGKKNIRKLLNGSDFIKDESITGSENSRNYLFELSLAGIFYQSGIDVSFDTEADFMFLVRAHVVGFVECKRVRSIANLQGNIEEAYKQIKTRCGERDIGIAGIDVTRLMWEHLNEELVCAGSEKIGPYLREVFFKVVSGVNGKYDFSNCLMLIGYWHIPYIRAEDNSLQYYRGMEVDMKYHEEHLSPEYQEKPLYKHRAEIALQIMEQLKEGMKN